MFFALAQRRRSALPGFLGLLIGLGCRCSGAADLWTTGYYAGWTQADMPASAIDFSALTHVIHFSVLPQPDGTINSTDFGLTKAQSASLIARAHAAGCKVLVCVGGAGTHAGFEGATTPERLPGFINTLATFASTRGYDGIDVDWEPLEASHAIPFQNLIHGLRAALDQRTPRPLLTAAVATEPALLASLQGEFDQINLMTYDMAGPWEGWVTWFNSPIFDGGYRFPSTGGLIPSADGLINRFLAAGVPAGKLAIGIAFYGNVWSGGQGMSTGGPSAPRQPWLVAPAVTAINYRDILSQYHTADRYHWDTNAQSAYLSINNPGSADDRFISFDDEHACQAKVSYARNRSLGGVMIWELAGAYFPAQPLGRRHPLLQSIKDAGQLPRLDPIALESGEVRLSFASMPLAWYRVAWTDDLAGGPWTVLTNLAGAGQTIEVHDAAPLRASHRYYRIQSP